MLLARSCAAGGYFTTLVGEIRLGCDRETMCIQLADVHCNYPDQHESNAGYFVVLPIHYCAMAWTCKRACSSITAVSDLRNNAATRIGRVLNISIACQKAHHCCNLFWNCRKLFKRSSDRVQGIFCLTIDRLDVDDSIEIFTSSIVRARVIPAVVWSWTTYKL